ncbi:hypothetical protein WSM22_05060 [Cytophagales bacterium WSM2-2]|nr:hypothetical protein WSM22_05060 [Cytophagales bacterium WSM2-2]
MISEIERITELLKKSFEGEAWHGPSVSEAIKDISEQKALQKPMHSHSIAGLVLHMASWRNFVTKKLAGDQTHDVSEQENFPAPTNWASAISQLNESQKALIAALKEFPEEKLTAVVPTRKYDFYTLLHGIIQHDLYHTGQIMILKK